MDFRNRLRRRLCKRKQSNLFIGGLSILKYHFSQTKLNDAYQAAKKRLLILDYDGTLMPFTPDPKSTVPDATLIELIGRLSSDEKNRLAIVSGRKSEQLESFFENQNVILSAEHGGMIRTDEGWKNLETPNPQWMNTIREIMESFVERNPRSRIEEKTFSIAWHFREVGTDVITQEKQKLMLILKQKLPPNTEIMRGNKIIEVRDNRINKGRIVKRLLKEAEYDFVLCAGDDSTDEDMFKMLPSKAWSFKIRDDRLTSADYIIGDYDEFRRILGTMAG